MEHVGQGGVFSLDQCSELRGQGPSSAQRNSCGSLADPLAYRSAQEGCGLYFYCPVWFS